jgi:DNA-binding transcriptional LysR family regulator
MDQLHLMHVFLAVSEEAGFAAGAKRLDISPAAVTRAIAALENHLGVSLFLRTTRSVRLTDAGRRYLDDTRNILNSIAEANSAAADIDSVPKGNLSVSSPVLFGKSFVMPCILRFLNQYPEVEISAIFSESIVSLVNEGIDVAVRIGNLPDSSLRARKVGDVRCVLCASPSYLAKNNVPEHPTHLYDHTIIATNEVSSGLEWKFTLPHQPSIVKVKPRLTVNSHDLAIDAAVSGLGICRLWSYQIAQHLLDGQLEIILQDCEDPPLPVYILHCKCKFSSSKVRRFVDMLSIELRANEILHESRVTHEVRRLSNPGVAAARDDVSPIHEAAVVQCRETD